MLSKSKVGGYVVALFPSDTRSETSGRVHTALAAKGWKFISQSAVGGTFELVMMPPVGWRANDEVAHDRVEALVDRIMNSPAPSVAQLRADSVYQSTKRERRGVKAVEIQREASFFAQHVLELTVDVDDLEAVVRSKNAKIENLQQSLDRARHSCDELLQRLRAAERLEAIHAEYRKLLASAAGLDR